jgi:hypothetical protein
MLKDFKYVSLVMKKKSIGVMTGANIFYACMKKFYGSGDKCQCYKIFAMNHWQRKNGFFVFKQVLKSYFYLRLI